MSKEKETKIVEQTLLNFDICRNKHGGNVLSVAANPKDDAKRKMRNQVLEFIMSRGEQGATSEEIALHLNIELHRVSGRCSELKKYNQVRVSGSRINKSGKSAAVLVARYV